jgi:hypothetical protein
MQKRSTFEILVALAVISGALYYVLYTERGRSWLDRVLDQAFDSMDAMLASLEKEMKGNDE